MKKVRRLDRYLLISYAEAFVSYLFRIGSIKDCDIRCIYLFGSVARGDFDKESDIDIFIETNVKGNLKSITDRAIKHFYNSDEKKKFSLMGIENDIKVMQGKLEEWELKDSIENDAIVLYSSSLIRGKKSYFLISIHPINDITKRNRVFRKICGRKEKYYKEKGLVQELGGEIIDSRIFIVPSESIDRITRIFSKERVTYSMQKIWK